MLRLGLYSLRFEDNGIGRLDLEDRGLTLRASLKRPIILVCRRRAGP